VIRTPAIGLQRTAAIASFGRSLRSLGSPLNTRPLGVANNVEDVPTYFEQPFPRTLRLASHDSLRFPDRPVRVLSSETVSLACRADRCDPHI
jgi:hypothetical protein